jgi:hypothetical protein
MMWVAVIFLGACSAASPSAADSLSSSLSYLEPNCWAVKINGIPVSMGQSQARALTFRGTGGPAPHRMLGRISDASIF